MMDKYKVEWIPQMPLKDGNKPFEVFVDSLEDAIKVSNLLSRYDLYQYETNIKLDYANAGIIFKYEQKYKQWSVVEDDDIDTCSNDVMVPDGTF